MDASDVKTLGAYNAEVARGIVHTSEWKEKMRQLQQEFDRAPIIRTVGQFCHDADKFKAW